MLRLFTWSLRILGDPLRMLLRNIDWHAGQQLDREAELIVLWKVRRSVDLLIA